MDAIKDQFEKVRLQMAALTASQRMLVGTLVAVMAVTVLFWGKFAASPEMVPVLDQQLSDADIGPINDRLRMAGIEHSVVAGKVMVPADRRAEILADLMYSQDLPRDTHSAFEDMTAKELNPFSPQSERETVYNQALQRELAGVIRKWPGVADAQVVINNKNERHIGETIPPTATVFITTRGKGGVDADRSRQLCQASADGVAGAVSGLKQKNIRVVIDGASQRPVDPDAVAETNGIGGSTQLELQQKVEAYAELKIRSQYAYIQGLTVTVTCDVENTTRVDNVHKVDKSGAFTQDTYSHKSDTDGRSGTEAAGEPGAATNTGVANVNNVGDATAGGGSVGGGGSVAGPVTSGTTSEETVGSISYVPQTDSTITTPAGKGSVKSVAVSVPMSYVAKLARAANPLVKDPTEADLRRVSVAESLRIRDHVAKAIGLASAENVSVDTFADDATGAVADLALATGTAPSAGGGSGFGGLAAHSKEIAVAALAAVSLAMMFQMARKAGTTLPTPAVAGFNGLPPGLAYGNAGGDDEAGESDDEHRGDGVGSTSGLVGGMAGVELDEETLRTQQMLDQVSTLVKEDPDAAAALVKRWVSRA